MGLDMLGGFPDGMNQKAIDSVELPPPARLVIEALRRKFGDELYITPRIPLDSMNMTLKPPRLPMILVRKGYPNGYLNIDERFLGSSEIEVNVFTADPEGELRGYVLSEAVRTTLRDAWENGAYFPGLGTLNRVRMVGEPTRKSDWANSTGPVQYADLPSGVWRTETTYRIIYRKDTEQGV